MTQNVLDGLFQNCAFLSAIIYIIHIISFQWTVDAVIMVIQVSAMTTRIGTFFSTTRLSSYGRL